MSMNFPVSLYGTLCMFLLCLKPSSQYTLGRAQRICLRCVATRSAYKMDAHRVHWNRNNFYSSVHARCDVRPNHFVCTSGRNACPSVYCEPGFSLTIAEDTRMLKYMQWVLNYTQTGQKITRQAASIDNSMTLSLLQLVESVTYTNIDDETRQDRTYTMNNSNTSHHNTEIPYSILLLVYHSLFTSLSLSSSIPLSQKCPVS